MRVCQNGCDILLSVSRFRKVYIASYKQLGGWILSTKLLFRWGYGNTEKVLYCLINVCDMLGCTCMQFRWPGECCVQLFQIYTHYWKRYLIVIIRLFRHFYRATITADHRNFYLQIIFSNATKYTNKIYKKRSHKTSWNRYFEEELQDCKDGGG